MFRLRFVLFGLNLGVGLISVGFTRTKGVDGTETDRTETKFTDVEHGILSISVGISNAALSGSK